MDSERELAGRDLDGKKGLIDQQLGGDEHRAAAGQRARARARGRPRAQVRRARPRAARSSARTWPSSRETTQGLREALSSTKARGQWGERMAEDVLQLAGFVEGIQYRKQVSVDGGSGIPDFTFLLPRRRRRCTWT